MLCPVLPKPPREMLELWAMAEPLLLCETVWTE